MSPGTLILINCMNLESRTSKSLRNAKIALLFYFLNLILQFFSRKVFLEYLGTEVLGLNTTAQNLLSFLNLAELGIASAIAYTLYKPLFERNRTVVNEIISVQGWLYRRIAFVIITGACILMCFFPWIFEKAQVPLWYAYGSFIVLLTSSLLGYFVNYRQIVLTADQQEYKVTLCVQGSKMVKVILQILAIYYLRNGYVCWMVLEFLMAFVTAAMINRVLRLDYPWLKASSVKGADLRRKYPHIIVKTKQLFFHRIGGFALEQVSPIIIYAYTSLTVVAIYGNYILIMTGVSLFVASLFNSVNAGIGHLVVEGKRERIIAVFRELFSSRFWISTSVCFGVYMLTPTFIRLWVGAEYLLDNTVLVLIVVISYIRLTRTTVDAFLSAYGLFSDVWATVTESLLNIGCSVLLGSVWGLHGVLVGIIISQVLIIMSWKPYFLCRKGIKLPFIEYVWFYFKHIAVAGMSFGICMYLLSWLPIDLSLTWSSFIIYGFTTVGIFACIEGLMLWGISQGMRDFVCRIHSIVCKRRLL